jgi:hypothetical protein
VGSILAVLSEAPELPQAEQLARMAMARGAIEPPAIIWPRATVALGSAPRRGKTRPVEGELAADELRLAIEPLVKVDDGASAETLFLTALPNLSFEARAEAAQRVAWMYLSAGATPTPGASPIMAVLAQPATGRPRPPGSPGSRPGGSMTGMRPMPRSARRHAGTGTEFNAAAYYWTARAAQASRREEVAPC